MEKNRTYKIVLTGLFAALCCIATFIHIPAGATGGFVNLGDCIVIASGILLKPVWGAAAGGIGSMLADIILGYAQYAPATFIIKAAMAFASGKVYHTLLKSCYSGKKNVILMLAAGILAEVIMVCGYFLYEAFVLGYGFGAIAGMPGNLLQASAGIIFCVPVSKLMEKIKILH